jgi:subtilase family serine protease
MRIAVFTPTWQLHEVDATGFAGALRKPISITAPAESYFMAIGSIRKAIKTWLRALGRKPLLPVIWFSAFFLCTGKLPAQTAVARITTDIDDSERATITGTHSPRATPASDAGRVRPGTTLRGVSMVFRRSAVQEARLQVLIAAQQDPASPLYHKWLTPDEFGAEFGVADSDIAKVEAWLEQQGFSVDSVSRSRNRITFSGTAGAVATSFGTELHYYKTHGQRYYAPSADISVPAALSSLVQSVANLSSFRPQSHVKFRPNFTSSQSGSHFLTPKDVATIYDINAAYTAGYTGAGQSIAVAGQSSVSVSDIEKFQSATGLTTHDPMLVLVPNSGTAAVSSGDESESDLDLEYSGGIATGAAIYLVYVGNNSNYSVWDSITYAVDTRIAPIITSSYGDCETELGSANYSTLNGILAQAAAQGQTVIAAAGDNGSTDCYGYTDLTTAQQQTLVVDFPASSQYVTGMGGTEFPAADVSSSNTTYWESSSGSDVISSALSYIPEQVWNDDSSSSGLSSGGGGVSTLTARPSWQTGVTGISSGKFRLVPDISLDASPTNAGYLFCSSDSTATGITGSCSNGFRDSSDVSLTVAGGTSFDAPMFAGMVAIINQKLNSTGEGVVNSALYTLAADSTTYASAFHDITSGGNKCTAGSTYCSTGGESEYSAATGYDRASGLGSIDFYNLLMAWPTTASSSLVASRTTLSSATLSPATGASSAITITVAPGSSSVTTTPTGTLTIAVDGTTETSSLALSSGSATYTFSSKATGSHVITATYSGDTTFAPSTATLPLTVGAASGTFTLAATNVTVSSGKSGTSTITITPKGGYAGTIGWTASTNPTLSNACYTVTNTAISGTSAVTATLNIYTSASACATAASLGTSGKRKLAGAGSRTSKSDGPRFSKLNAARAIMVIVAGLVAGLAGYRPRKQCRLAGVCFVFALGLGLVACGGSTSPPTSTSNAAKGTYTLTIVGTDTSSSSIAASTAITLTID